MATIKNIQTTDTAIELNYDVLVDIDITPAEDVNTWVRFGEGFNNVSKSFNNVIHDTSYFGDGGWGSSHSTGGQFTMTITGERITGDKAQDYIFGKKVAYTFGKTRKTTLRLTKGLEVVYWDVTITQADETGGDATAVNAVTVEFKSNGAPLLQLGATIDDTEPTNLSVTVLNYDSTLNYAYILGSELEALRFNEVLPTNITKVSLTNNQFNVDNIDSANELLLISYYDLDNIQLVFESTAFII